ncbi:hypothetical protein VTN96DRAFT_5026 [Rasamsonia emersonii]
MGTPSLLGLPQELRDIILDLVLFTERAPPQDEATALEGRVNRHDCTDSEYERWTNRVLHEDLEDATASGPLLRVNRKLAADTRRALARPRKNKADLLRQPYILDILAVSGRRLLPTWLFAPALVLCVDEVVATIRMGSYEDPLESLESVMREGLFPSIVASFHELMKRFVCCGPGSARRNGSSDKGIVIKTLTVNIASNDDEPVSNSERLG